MASATFRKPAHVGADHQVALVSRQSSAASSASVEDALHDAPSAWHRLPRRSSSGARSSGSSPGRRWPRRRRWTPWRARRATPLYRQDLDGLRGGGHVGALAHDDAAVLHQSLGSRPRCSSFWVCAGQGDVAGHCPHAAAQSLPHSVTPLVASSARYSLMRPRATSFDLLDERQSRCRWGRRHSRWSRTW